MMVSKTLFPKTSSFCEYYRIVPQIIELINTYFINTNIETPASLKSLIQEKTFNHHQSSFGISFEFKLIDNHLHYNSYIIHFNSSSDNFNLNFSRSSDFPYGIVQFEYNSSLTNSPLHLKITEIIDIYSKMIETSYRKNINNSAYEINFNTEQLCISNQTNGYSHSGSGSCYTYDEFLNKKKGQSFIKSNFDKDLLEKITEEVRRRIKYPHFYAKPN